MSLLESPAYSGLLGNEVSCSQFSGVLTEANVMLSEIETCSDPMISADMKRKVKYFHPLFFHLFLISMKQGCIFSTIRVMFS